MARPRQQGRQWGYAWVAVLTNEALSSHAKVLHSYVDYLMWRNRGEPIDWTMKELGAALGLSENTVRKARRELEAAGLLVAKTSQGRLALTLPSYAARSAARGGEQTSKRAVSRARGSLSEAERARANALARRNYPWEALVEVTQADPLAERAKIGVGLRRIKRVWERDNGPLPTRPGERGRPVEDLAAPEQRALEFEIRRRALLYVQRYGDVELTPTALASNWTRVTTERPRRRTEADLFFEEGGTGDTRAGA